MRILEYLSELQQDVVFALRQMWATPAFTVTALLTLAIGIGATTAIFSAVNAVVLRPLPVRDPDRLVFVTEFTRGFFADVSAGNFVDTAARQRTFEQLAAINFTSFNLSENGTPERLIGAQVTASFFPVFGMPPAVGRVFSQAEDQPGHERVVVLSHRLWRRRFGADLTLVGRDIRLNGQPYSVVGVMPASFDITSTSEELWVPIAFTPERKATHDEHYLTVVGRLRPGVSVDQANADLHPIALRLRKEFPKDDIELDLRAVSFMQLFVGNYRQRLLLLLGAVGLVLLIACGNVANLLLARGAARVREIALRNALGAGRARLIRQLITESLVLATLAATAGTALAFWLVRSLVLWSPPGVPRLEQARVDGVTLGFAAGIAVLSSLLFGCVPAWRASRLDVSSALKDGGRGTGGRPARDWVRFTLIAAEIAVSVVLLVGAGLLIRSGVEMHRMKTGFDPDGVIAARLSLPPEAYAEPARATEAFRQIAENTRRIPGVTAAAVVSQPPLSAGGNGNGLIPEGKAFDIRNMILARLRIVTPGYFNAIGTPIIKGRAFDDHDMRSGQKVMIISRSLAETFWPGQDPLGRRIACCEPNPDGSPSLKVVVGVADDVYWQGPMQPISPEFYLPMSQIPGEAWNWIQRTMYIVARTDGDPAALAPALRRITAAVDPAVPLFDMKTMRQRAADNIATERFNTLLLTLLGVVGLLLSAVGIYGVIGYFVTQRTAEIGVRIALGATRGDVTRMILRQASKPVMIGIVAGAVGAVAATRLLASQLVNVRPTDPVAFGAALAALIAVSLVASIIPARRAAALEPTRALQVA